MGASRQMDPVLSWGGCMLEGELLVFTMWLTSSPLLSASLPTRKSGLSGW